MKQSLEYDQFWEFLQRYPQACGKFVLWAYKKGYTDNSLTYLPTVGELVHFLKDSRHFHYDLILAGVHDYGYEFENFTIAWDGEELIDILWYETVQVARKELNNE